MWANGRVLVGVGGASAIRFWSERRSIGGSESYEYAQSKFLVKYMYML